MDHIAPATGASRYLTDMIHPDLGYPKELTDLRDIYELNFIPMQYLLNLITKYNIHPTTVNILMWGCGPCVVDYYLDKLGFNITSYDNWSQIGKESVTNFLKSFEDNEGYKHGINFVDDVETLSTMDFDVLYDTGNFMDIGVIIKNPTVKIIFTWQPDERMGASNIEYLNTNFTRHGLPGCIIFLNNSHFNL